MNPYQTSHLLFIFRCGPVCTTLASSPLPPTLWPPWLSVWGKLISLANIWHVYPGKVLKKFFIFLSSAEGMKAGNYGNLLVQIEQPRGEYSVTIAFLRLITTLVKVMAYLTAIETQQCFLPSFVYQLLSGSIKYQVKMWQYFFYIWFPAALMCLFPSGSAWQHSEQRPDPMCVAGAEGDVAYLP